MEDLHNLEALGYSLPSPAYIFGLILFGLLGFGVYRYGKKAPHPPAKWIGIALMLYPYAVSSTWALYLVGAALCGALYWYRK